MASMIDEDRLSQAYETALKAEKAGEFERAASAYRQCLAIDPDDHAGARVRIAAMGIGEAPASAGHAYVATLFDQHADDFEDILVRQLRYGVPAMIAQKLAQLRYETFARCLDLGCGTGLMGEALDGRADMLIGVDLSEGMIETCFDKAVYDDLYIGEAVEFLEEFEETDPFDLVVAADVLPYLGSLAPLFAAVARRAAPGAIFAFSSETLPPEAFGGRPFAVGRRHRFHHDPAYVLRELAEHGFDCLEQTAITVRMEQGEPAAGHLFIARRSV